MPVVIAELLAILGPWIMRFFAFKAVLMFAGFLGRLGLVLATNEYVMEPMINHAVTAWSGMPVEYKCWLSLFGVTEAAGIMVSGITLIAAKRVFFGKKD